MQYQSIGFILTDTVTPLNPDWLKAGETQDFPIYYKGPAADTISIGKRYWSARAFYPEKKQGLFKKSYNSNDLEITADTSVSCFAGIDYLGENGKYIADSAQWFHAVLLILKNKSDSTLYMGRTSSLYFMQLEGQCKDGQWTRIQKPLSEEWICGTNKPDIFLRPGEIILSKIIRRADPGFIRYRLAWKGGGKVIYSNTFTM